jgi:phosphoribosylcarboxyaminoimidazole (NCAIR) mutase
MAFTPNNFPAALAEIRRLAEENDQLRQKLAELQKTCGDTVKRGRPKTQDKDAQP